MSKECFKTLLEPFGELTYLKFLKPQNDGKTAYGFVAFSDLSDSSNAIKELNGKVVDEHVIRASFARPEVQVLSTTNLYVCGLPLMYKSEQLKEIFEPFGEINDTRVLNNTILAESKGVGFVHFRRPEDARAAVAAMNNTTPPGINGPLVVKFARDIKKNSKKLKGGDEHQSQCGEGHAPYGGNGILCKYYQSGKCNRGSDCNFIHGEEETFSAKSDIMRSLSTWGVLQPQAGAVESFWQGPQQGASSHGRAFEPGVMQNGPSVRSGTFSGQGGTLPQKPFAVKPFSQKPFGQKAFDPPPFPVRPPFLLKSGQLNSSADGKKSPINLPLSHSSQALTPQNHIALPSGFANRRFNDKKFEMPSFQKSNYGGGKPIEAREVSSFQDADRNFAGSRTYCNNLPGPSANGGAAIAPIQTPSAQTPMNLESKPYSFVKASGRSFPSGAFNDDKYSSKSAESSKFSYSDSKADLAVREYNPLLNGFGKSQILDKSASALGEGEGGGFGAGGISKTNLYVSQFPREWTSSDLERNFSKFGEIDKIRILTPDNADKNRGVGFVHFQNQKSAQNAITTMQNYIPKESNKPIIVKFANQGSKNNRNLSIQPGVCKFWMKGECARGDLCSFKHESQPIFSSFDTISNSFSKTQLIPFGGSSAFLKSEGDKRLSSENEATANASPQSSSFSPESKILGEDEFSTPYLGPLDPKSSLFQNSKLSSTGAPSSTRRSLREKTAKAPSPPRRRPFEPRIATEELEGLKSTMTESSKTFDEHTSRNSKNANQPFANKNFVPLNPLMISPTTEKLFKKRWPKMVSSANAPRKGEGEHPGDSRRIEYELEFLSNLSRPYCRCEALAEEKEETRREKDRLLDEHLVKTFVESLCKPGFADFLSRRGKSLLFFKSY